MGLRETVPGFDIRYLVALVLLVVVLCREFWPDGQ